MDDEIVMNSYGVLAELLDYKIVESMGLHTLSRKGIEEEKEERKSIFPRNKKK